MRRLLLCAAILASCSKTQIQGAGIRADVTTDPTVQADCVAVVAWAADGGDEHRSDLADRRGMLQFGIAEGDGLSGTIRLVARGYLGDCKGAPTLNAESDPEPGTFVEGNGATVVTLELKHALNDSDNDGFRAADAGGTDCDDSNPAINPGVAEVCNDGIDNNCNGKIDCADSPACDGVSCDDGQACSTNDACHAGVCIGMSAQCGSPPAGGCFHLPGQCLIDGGCTYAVDVGSACDGGVCASNGACVPPNTEVNCADGIDNDGDGLIDCADPDCAGQVCNDGNVCTDNDTCAGTTCAGTPKACTTPPTGPCYGTGSCQVGTGACVYPIATGQACDDSNPCTTGDQCAADAGCAGTPKACNTPPSACYVQQGSCSAGTCMYAVSGAAACDDSNPCTVGDHCDLSGTCAGTGYTCNAPPTCYGGGTCLGDGGCNYSPVSGGTCNGGTGVCVSGSCQTAASAFPYTPSNFPVPDAGWSPAVHLTFGCDPDFDSSAETFAHMCGQTLPAPQDVQLSDGTTAVLLPFGGLNIDTFVTFTIRGNKPVIIAVAGDATMNGEILRLPVGNAMGCGSGTGNGGGFSGGGRGSGGGGGAFGSVGSSGGGVPSTSGGNAGAVASSLTLVPLRGGCSGGNGGTDSNNAGTGGAGGGAIQLSVAGTLTLGGYISAGGAGGQAGQGTSSGGGGGGSGGGVLVEANTLNIGGTAKILTNGGGGGEGASSNAAGQNGQDGSYTNVNTAPGGALNPSGGDGANGATGITTNGTYVAAGATTSAASGSAGAGAGGGGVGSIVVRGAFSCSLSGSGSGAVTKQGVCP
jgi:hypothetical protein